MVALYLGLMIHSAELQEEQLAAKPTSEDGQTYISFSNSLPAP